MVREALPLGLSTEASEGVRFFRLSDPAFGHDRVTVTVPNDDLNGQILSDVAWINIPGKRDQNRYATLRLRWTDEEESRIALDELVCWEFLGLGGEVGNAVPKNAQRPNVVTPQQDTRPEAGPRPISYREGKENADLIDAEASHERNALELPVAPRSQPEFSEDQ
tara:strand:+ start:28 stop:522 length:495 start_codon:yes stop_codon:yes gene_type:complete